MRPRTDERAVSASADVFDGIDALVNNAGKYLTRYDQPFSALPRDGVRALFAANVMGVVNCSAAYLALMRDRGGGPS